MRRWLKTLVWVSVIATFAVPVAADDFTGSEKEMRTLQCPKNGEPVPENHEKPGPGECDSTTKTTYQGYVWTNNVKCAGGEKADAQGVKVYQTGSGTSGGVGICNEGKGEVGSRVPVQGRAVAQGSQDGGNVYIDGDKDNSNATAQGWARADGKFNGTAPAVRCGDDNGRKDASEPTASDQQADCG